MSSGSSSSMSSGISSAPSINTISSSPLVSPSDTSSMMSRTGESSSWSFPNISLEWILIIIVVLALIGINIFVYLAKDSKEMMSLIGPTLANILQKFGLLTNEIVDNTETGLEASVNVVKKAATDGVDIMSTSVKNNESAAQEDNTPDQYYIDPKCQKKNECPIPESNEAGSSLRNGNLTGEGESGWCYIGEDRGITSCIEVNAGDKCMSGDIFPSRDVCINPNIRGN